ncbi:MAG: VCBS repeat-containing protein [Planctomycetota bacterium]
MGKVLAAGGDINGDGRPDGVALSNTEVRWTSNGDTKFTADFLVEFASQSGTSSNAASLAMGDVNHDGWVDVLAGDPISGIVTVTSPGDPNASLSTLRPTISAASGGNIVLYINPSGPLAPLCFYFMLASGGEATPGSGFLLNDGSELLLVQDAVFWDSLANPFAYFEENLEFFGPNGTEISRIAAGPGDLLGAVGAVIWAGFGAVDLPAPAYSHSASSVVRLEVTQ